MKLEKNLRGFLFTHTRTFHWISILSWITMISLTSSISPNSFVAYTFSYMIFVIVISPDNDNILLIKYFQSCACDKNHSFPFLSFISSKIRDFYTQIRADEIQWKSNCNLNTTNHFWVRWRSNIKSSSDQQNRIGCKRASERERKMEVYKHDFDMGCFSFHTKRKTCTYNDHLFILIQRILLLSSISMHSEV